MLHFLLLVSVLTMLTVIWCGPVPGELVNVTVDDQGADPTSKYGISYDPQWTMGQTCSSSCQARPDSKQAHGGTWRDMTYDPSTPDTATPQNATFDFTGSAIYVYGIQSQSEIDPVSEADIVFYIDGIRMGNYKFTPNQDSNAYAYNQLLFKIEGLEQASHALGIQNGQIGGPISLILLDYLVYSTDNSGGASVPIVSLAGIPSASSVSAEGTSGSTRPILTTSVAQTPVSHNSHSLSSAARTAIVAVSAALGTVLLSVFVWWMWRRRSKASTSTFVHIDAPLVTTNVVQVIAPAYSDPAPSYVSIGPPSGAVPPVTSTPLAGKEDDAECSTLHQTLEVGSPAIDIEPLGDSLSQEHTQSLVVQRSVAFGPELPVHEGDAVATDQRAQPTS